MKVLFVYFFFPTEKKVLEDKKNFFHANYRQNPAFRPNCHPDITIITYYIYILCHSIKLA